MERKGNSGRGRGRAKSTHGTPGRQPSKETYLTKIKRLNLPQTEQDLDIVECSDCSKQCTFREFRYHNLLEHYNLAKTKEDDTEIDHNYYTRKLMEMGKLLKISFYFCPRTNCDAAFKSALGLTYHLKTCGLSKDEIVASLVECEICRKKFSPSTINSHKKYHVKEISIQNQESGTSSSSKALDPSRKRKSAVKAMEYMKDIVNSSKTIPEDEEPELKHKSSQLDPDVADRDFNLSAYHQGKQYEDESENNEAYEDADEPVKIGEIREKGRHVFKSSKEFEQLSTMFDFEEVSVKKDLTDSTIKSQELNSIRKYKKNEKCIGTLGDLLSSVSSHLVNSKQYSTSNLDSVSINYLSGVIENVTELEELTDTKEIRTYLPDMESSLTFCVETTHSDHQSKKSPKKKCEKIAAEDKVQINWFSNRKIKSNTEERKDDFLYFCGGPVTSCSWHPACNCFAISTCKRTATEHNFNETLPEPTSLQIYMRGGTNNEAEFKLCLILALDYGHISHLKWSPYYPKPIDETKENLLGYLAASCQDGTIRILAINKKFLTLPFTFSTIKNSSSTDKNVRVYRKAAELTLRMNPGLKLSNCQPITFDWDNTGRRIVGGYSNGYIAVFNVLCTSSALRTDYLYDCGIRFTHIYPVWIVDGHSSPITSVIINPVFPNLFYTASKDHYLKCWDFDLREETECKSVGCVSSMSFFKGSIHLTVCVDVASSNTTTQLNYVRMYQIGSQFGRPHSIEHFNVTCSSFHEGMTLFGFENGRVTIAYYDSIWKESDVDRNKKKKHLLHLVRVTVDRNSYKAIERVRSEDAIRLESEDSPSVKWNFSKSWVQFAQEPEPDYIELEELVRFYPQLRVNQVSWSPNGNLIMICYHNGLVGIINADFIIS